MVNQRKRSLQLSLFLVAVFFIWAIRHTLFSAVDDSIASPTLWAAYYNLVKLVVWILPACGPRGQTLGAGCGRGDPFGHHGRRPPDAGAEKSVWVPTDCAREDSNLQPTGSKPATLSN